MGGRHPGSHGVTARRRQHFGVDDQPHAIDGHTRAAFPSFVGGARPGQVRSHAAVQRAVGVDERETCRAAGKSPHADSSRLCRG